MNFPRAFLCLGPLLFLAACSTGGDTQSSPGGATTMSQRLNDKSGYTQDSEGNWKATGGRRSSFESNRESAYFKEGFQGQQKRYKTGDYAKKSWWGNKEYGRQAYQGKTDGSRFQKDSALAAKNARETGGSARLPGEYRTEGYSTGVARETSGKRLDKPSDAETDVRRRVFTPPSEIDWREQRSMTIGQSKSLLGR